VKPVSRFYLFVVVTVLYPYCLSRATVIDSILKSTTSAQNGREFGDGYETKNQIDPSRQACPGEGGVVKIHTQTELGFFNAHAAVNVRKYVYGSSARSHVRDMIFMSCVYKRLLFGVTDRPVLCVYEQEIVMKSNGEHCSTLATTLHVGDCNTIICTDRYILYIFLFSCRRHCTIGI